MSYIFGTFDKLLKYKPPPLNSVDFKLVIPRHVMEKRKIGSSGLLYVRNYQEPFARIRLTDELFHCHEKIIECVVAGGEWEMVRVRTDNDIANAFQTAISIKESIERSVAQDLLLNTIAKGQEFDKIYKCHNDIGFECHRSVISCDTRTLLGRWRRVLKRGRNLVSLRLGTIPSVDFISDHGSPSFVQRCRMAAEGFG
ncbi:hypothetical protein ACOME3_008886 [Neoechinorhynchus agilis]